MEFTSLPVKLYASIAALMHPLNPFIYIYCTADVRTAVTIATLPTSL